MKGIFLSLSPVRPKREESSAEGNGFFTTLLPNESKIFAFSFLQVGFKGVASNKKIKTIKPVSTVKSGKR